MVDYTELRKKFKAKNPQLDEKRRKKQLAIKKIAREYEAKKAEIAGVKFSRLALGGADELDRARRGAVRAPQLDAQF